MVVKVLKGVLSVVFGVVMLMIFFGEVYLVGGDVVVVRILLEVGLKKYLWVLGLCFFYVLVLEWLG